MSIRSEELQAQEIRCGNSIRLGDGKGASDAVGFDAQGRVAREFFVHRQIVNLGDNFETLMSGLCSVDHDDRAVVRRKLHVHRFEGFLRTKISAGGTQIVTVKMPDQAGPSVVEHPLNDAGGFIFVAAIGLEHCALAFVAHSLRFPSEVGGAFRFAVALFESRRIDAEGLELAAACMKTPVIVNGPKLVLGDECF